jgi:SAM-dependent methyltransferase
MRFHAITLILATRVMGATVIDTFALGASPVTVVPVVAQESAAQQSPTQQSPARESPSVTFPRAPYVATPEPVVAAMLELANVSSVDLLYDLGSGDGRVVIMAARDRGARGIGIDIDPDRIKEGQENARRARVAERVRFLRQDLFNADIGEATVVTLYLSPELNRRLSPKLRGELRPGTRIVSHRYDLGDWPPVKSLQVNVNGVTHWVFYWVVPSPGEHDARFGGRPSGREKP